MIPIVRTYHRNPVYLNNIYNDKYCGGSQETFNQKVNIIENENDFTLDLVAPGFSKDEIKVTIDKDELTIKSILEESSGAEAKQNYLRREFEKTSINRSFKLPKNVEGDKIQASHNNGILSIVLPKRAKVEVQVKDIDVK